VEDGDGFFDGYCVGLRLLALSAVAIVDVAHGVVVVVEGHQTHFLKWMDAVPSTNENSPVCTRI
jgi:hypothetical protein